ncbi:DUF2188 domain-containing protein [Domibacillus sp.]|nr:DUF2188 domain-containing protein [Domibacillus sp.]
MVPHGDGEWAVKTEGKDEPNDTFASKSEAVGEAKKNGRKSRNNGYYS